MTSKAFTDALESITATFQALPDEAQLLLLDHLADVGGFELDSHELAVSYFSGFYRTDDRVMAAADRLFPSMLTRAQRDAFVADRQRKLEYYLRAIARRKAA